MDERKVSTGGGAYVGKSVDTSGGDFVGRDQVKTIGPNVSVIAELFKPIYAAIETRPDTSPDNRDDITAEVKDIQAEVVKGDVADESFLARRLRNLKRMAPDILEVVLTALTSPAAGVGMIASKVAQKMRDATT